MPLLYLNQHCKGTKVDYVNSDLSTFDIEQMHDILFVSLSIALSTDFLCV